MLPDSVLKDFCVSIENHLRDRQGLYQRVDQAGGIDGHQINFTQCSDGAFVAQSQDLSYTCAQTAASNHVLAVVGSNSQYDSVTYPVLAANHIPDIGSFPMQPVDYTSPESTPFGQRRARSICLGRYRVDQLRRIEFGGDILREEHRMKVGGELLDKFFGQRRGGVDEDRSWDG